MSMDMGIRQIIAGKKLTALFQPIIDCRTLSIYGYEALIRGPSDSSLHSPHNLLDAAELDGSHIELDYLCREVAINRFRQTEIESRLFINSHPMALEKAATQLALTNQIIEQNNLTPEKITFEFTEPYPFSDLNAMRRSLDLFREKGYQIAIDHIGTGHLSHRHWEMLGPDYLKLDRYLIQGIEFDPHKQELVSNIIDKSQQYGGQIIAQGIESRAAYQTLSNLGITLGQGFFFFYPQSQPPSKFCQLQGSLFNQQALSLSGETVLKLCKNITPVPPQISADAVAQRFHHSPAIQSIPIVDENQFPVGIISKNDLLNRFSQRYGRSLYSQSSIIDIANTDPLIVPHSMPVEQLSQLITHTGNHSTDDDFIIVDDSGHFIGMGTVIELLRTITDLQIRSARYSNPLTQLPGNVPINQQIDELIRLTKPFTVVWCDLDNFKPFNDFYGYNRGDNLILCLSNLLKEAVNPEIDFLGHIGGDDFIMVLRSEDWHDRCQNVLDRFQAIAPLQYDKSHRQAGGISEKNRQGNPVFFPLVSLSLAIIPVEENSFESHSEIAAALVEVKKQAKAIDGNSLFIDRRKVPEQITSSK